MQRAYNVPVGSNFETWGLAMRKTIVLLGGLLVAVAFSGTAAKAELGCVCAKLGQNLSCTSGVSMCTGKMGGACVLPCDYQAPKKAVRMSKKKKPA
jgi:hypothetical protein